MTTALTRDMTRPLRPQQRYSAAVAKVRRDWPAAQGNSQRRDLGRFTIEVEVSLFVEAEEKNAQARFLIESRVVIVESARRVEVDG